MDALIKGFGLGLLLAISVGPIVFTVIKQSISMGRRGGFAFIAGISCSDIMLVFLSNLFTNLFAELNAHKRVLSTIASIFLILVGLYYLFVKKPTVKQDKPLGFTKTDYAKIFAKGFVMNIFNPGIIIFWLTTATTFLDQTLNQRIIIFTTALIIALVADVAKVLLASKIREKLNAKNIDLVNKINGAILVGFGVVIIFLAKH